jgi:hypothetical protein
MRHLALILTLIAATPALAEGPVQHKGGLPACRHYSDWTILRQIGKDKDREGFARFLQEKGCIALKAGTFYADVTIGDNQCVRLQGESECWWTIQIVH